MLMHSRSDELTSAWRARHPLAVSSILLAHLIVSFLFEYHPLYQIGQLLFLILWAIREGLARNVWIVLRFGLYISILFLIVNPLFASHGELFLWKGPIFPLIGRLDFSLEEIMFSLIGLIRLYSILVLSVMFQSFIDHDRFFFMFAKIAPRLVMTSIMSIRLFPLISREFARIKEVSRLRGIRPQGSGLIHRIRYYALLLRPLLLSFLEGAWLTAEALYARGFGSGKRTTYQEHQLQPRELIGCLMCGMMVGLVIWGKGIGFMTFIFYPSFLWSDPLGDFVFILFLLALWLLPIYWLRGRDEHVHSPM
jgi:energy-coupling factor transport system permease protein